MLGACVAVPKDGLGTFTVIGIPWRFTRAAVAVFLSPDTDSTVVLVHLDCDEKRSKEGGSESGVCRAVRVVSGRVASSDGSGPVTVGYVPVQYDTVVEIFGDGNTKLT